MSTATSTIPTTVAEALASGQVLLAITRWQRSEGLTLAEATRRVEDLQRGLG